MLDVEAVELDRPGAWREQALNGAKCARLAGAIRP